MAEMAHQSWAGNAIRGMTMCVLSNGGGVGISKAINGGFGLVLDGSERVDEIIRSALDWDVIIGVGRRSWARNPHAIEVTKQWNDQNRTRGHVTEPEPLDEILLNDLDHEK
jgi:urocanate hydratase